MTLFLTRIGALCAVVLLLACGAAVAAGTRLEGSFIGLAEAEGMRLELNRSGKGISGSFHDSNGQSADFTGTQVGTTIEATLKFPNKLVRIRIFPESIGLRLIAVPFDTAGQPVIEASLALIFVPPGTAIPKIPPGYQDPVFRKRVVDPDTFLISYEFWPPEAVAFGFESIEDRYRPLIGLFPVVMTDILWKLCESSYQPAVMGEALRGQGVTCDQVEAKINELQARSKFDGYKADVAAEKVTVLAAARCARGYLVAPSVCEPAARAVAAAAVSMVTVAAVLRRY